jgi:hypothetical protein
MLQVYAFPVIRDLQAVVLLLASRACLALMPDIMPFVQVLRVWLHLCEGGLLADGERLGLKPLL